MKKDTNQSKKLNGKLIKESLVNYNNLAQELKENVTESVKSLLDEQVKEAYAAILNESEDETKESEYDIEEVEDTQDDLDKDQTEETSGTTEDDSAEVDGTESATDEVSQEDDEEDSEDEEDLDFEKYKVSDDTYDFRNAKDDEIVKVYKRLTDDNQVTVVMDDNKVEVSDKETGAEYIIDLSGNNDSENDEDDASENNYEIEIDDMKESRIYEVALNDYTDDYQNKDVMTSDGVEEPGNGRDIDKGVPHTTKKPWSHKKDAAPFNGKKAMATECGGVSADNNAPDMEETVAQKGGTKRMMGVKSHVPNTSCKDNPKAHVASVAGEYQNESIIQKANRIFEENKKLKRQLDKITGMLREAAVTNVNLGGIIKLISENSTSKEEKRDIINRFTNEVHTIEESKRLYQAIDSELKKNPHVASNINEEHQFGNSNADVINESKFYQDESLMNSLGLMHRICK